jgi:threonyl-tRNA synthetase
MPHAIRRRQLDAIEHLIATPDRLVPLRDIPLSDLSNDLASLVDHEVYSPRPEIVPSRVVKLCRAFGFEWEPLGERGHMRLLPAAAFMFRQTYHHAGEEARQTAESLGAQFFWIDGVNVVDGHSPILARYRSLLANEPGLYGIRPYEISSEPPAELLLRQTGCVQKFAICREWSFESTRLPVAVFEISQSFRCEPAETLQLCARLRRFSLPESHIHAKSIDEALRLTEDLHRTLIRQARGLADNVQLLVSASGELVEHRSKYFMELANSLERPILVRAYPRHSLCRDGVDLDVEYKIIDSLGCPREFSTFQIDRKITRVFGLGGSSSDIKGRLTTIHVVSTSSVERNIFFQFDRIAASEARGGAAALPLWLSPVVVRVLASRAELEAGMIIIGQLENGGIRADVDDRAISLRRKLEGAKIEAVPYQIVLQKRPHSGRLLVREHQSGLDQEMSLGELISRISSGVRRSAVAPFGRQLSRRPINTRPEEE